MLRILFIIVIVSAQDDYSSGNIIRTFLKDCRKPLMTFQAAAVVVVVVVVVAVAVVVETTTAQVSEVFGRCIVLDGRKS